MLEFRLRFVPKGLINKIPTLAHIMAWRRSGDKPLSEPMMVSLLTHICVIRPQWVKQWLFYDATLDSVHGWGFTAIVLYGYSWTWHNPKADLAIICWSELSWTDEILRDLCLDVSHRFWDDRNLFIITTYLGTILRRYSAFFSVENKDLVIVHPRTLYFMTGRHIEPGL